MAEAMAAEPPRGKAMAGSTVGWITASTPRGTPSAAVGAWAMPMTLASQPNWPAAASGSWPCGFQPGASKATRSPQRTSGSRR